MRLQKAQDFTERSSRMLRPGAQPPCHEEARAGCAGCPHPEACAGVLADHRSQPSDLQGARRPPRDSSPRPRVPPVPQACQLRSQTRWSRDYGPLFASSGFPTRRTQRRLKKKNTKQSIIGLPLVQWLRLRAPNAGLRFPPWSGN